MTPVQNSVSIVVPTAFEINVTYAEVGVRTVNDGPTGCVFWPGNDKKTIGDIKQNIVHLLFQLLVDR